MTMNDYFYYSPRLTHDELCLLFDIAADANKYKAFALGAFMTLVVSDEMERRKQPMEEPPKEFTPFEFPTLNPSDTRFALTYLNALLDNDWYYRQSNGTQDFLSYCLAQVRGLTSYWLSTTPAPFKSKIELCRPCTDITSKQ